MGRRSPTFPPVYPKNPKPGQRTFARVYRNGKATDIPLGPAGSEQAKAEYRRLLIELDSGALPQAARKSATVAEAILRWMEHASEVYSPTGRELENHRLSLRPLLALYGPTPAAEFNARSLEVVQKAMASGSWMSEVQRAEAEKRKRPPGWCRNVVNRRIVRIQTAWRWLEKEGVVPAGSSSNLKTLRGLARNAKGVRHTAKVKPAFWADVVAVLPHVQARRKRRPVAAMLQLQFLGAMRSCEVRVMRTVDIDRTEAVWLYTPLKHKNEWREDETPRTIPLGPEAQKVLAAWLRDDAPETYLFAPSAAQATREHYMADTYANVVRRACRKAGVRFRPYALRHGARLRITREMGLDAARAVLGHSAVSMTAQYAAAQDIETAQEVARKLG